MKISYYPGCTLKSNAKNFEDSALAAMQALGVEMQELPRWNCCGTVFSLASDDLMHHLAPIRILLRAKEQGNTDLVTLCSMCYHTLRLSNTRVQENPGDLEKLNNMMYKENTTYDGGVSVHHLLKLLKDKVGFRKVKENVKVDLGGLRVAPYYGCLLLRPQEISIDPSMENPTIMSEFIEACGAVPVEFSHQTECCGAYLTVNEKELVGERSYEILSSAQRAGADLVLTSCPLCQFNLDNRQQEVKASHLGFGTIPILYFTQLLALSMGFDESVVRFDLNWVDPRPVLEGRKIQIAS